MAVAAVAVGAFAWMHVASWRDGWIDSYWATHGFPPAVASLPAHLMPTITFAPLMALVFLRLVAWAIRRRRSAARAG